MPLEEAPSNLVASRKRSQKTQTRANARRQTSTARAKTASSSKTYRTYPDKYPQVVATGSGSGSKLAKVNNIPGIIVGGGDGFEELSKVSGVTVQRIKYYNDLKGSAS